ncbi:hypothetical protein D3C84_799900 [compost metagenome]
MHVVSKKRWQVETDCVAFTETVIQCADFPAVLAALTGYRLQNGTPPVDPRILFGLFDPKVQQCPVALWAIDGLADSVTIHRLN